MDARGERLALGARQVCPDAFAKRPRRYFASLSQADVLGKKSCLAMNTMLL
jgi:hypothetical protein